MTLSPRLQTALIVAGIGVLAAVLLLPGRLGLHASRPTRVRAPGSSPNTATDRETLVRTISTLRARVARQPDDLAAAQALADALLRQARITGNGGLAVDAERVLRTGLREAPGDYDTRRMLCAVLLSQHRFRDASELAEALQRERPADAWNSGVIGDASIELGDYDRAFDAFQRMIDTRPDAAAYARASYARELQGDLDGALAMMRMAAEATSPKDLESLAWHHAQIGNLLLQLGRTDEARRSFERAAHFFPGHPFPVVGLARTRAASGDLIGALHDCESALAVTQTLPLAALAGDVALRLGRPEEAERYYAQAEQIAREMVSSEGTLARFLSERHRKPAEALALARQLAATRDDIFTDDLLAWACFNEGQSSEARAASARALRTGTRNPAILLHAAAITASGGDEAGARRLLRESIAAGAGADALLGPLVMGVQARVRGHVELARNGR